MTTTEAPPELELACHCTADAEGHAPGADSCTERVPSARLSSAKTWTPAATYRELARVAGTPAERARWGQIATLHRGIERHQAELDAGYTRVRRALRVVKVEGRWAVLHVPGDAALLGGLESRREAEDVREDLIAEPVRWTAVTLAEGAKRAVRTHAAQARAVVAEAAR